MGRDLTAGGGAIPVPVPIRARGLRALAAALSMIKFQHTVFALPFAFCGALLAADGLPPWRTIGWILGAMVGARSAAMVFNRIADRDFDRRNPRTAARPLATGVLGVPFAWGLLVASAALFVISAAMLNRLAFVLSVPALLLTLSYSYAKRLTWLTHLHLGIALGLAPLGAWIGVRGSIEAAPLALAAAVALWVAGFDIIYACQDIGFDRANKLRSVPARFGIHAALRASAVLHAGTVLLLAMLPLFTPLGVIYLGGVAAVALLLTYEHRLVRPDDLARVDQAFFIVNGWISFLVLLAMAADRALT